MQTIGFEQWTSGVRSDRSTFWATTSFQLFHFLTNTNYFPLRNDKIMFQRTFDVRRSDTLKCNSKMDKWQGEWSWRGKIYQKRDAFSVTSKKSPNAYKSCPKGILLVKLKILIKFTKIALMCWHFGQNICCNGLWKVAQSPINCPIWLHWMPLKSPFRRARKSSTSFRTRTMTSPFWSFI